MMKLQPVSVNKQNWNYIFLWVGTFVSFPQFIESKKPIYSYLVLPEIILQHVILDFCKVIFYRRYYSISLMQCGHIIPHKEMKCNFLHTCIALLLWKENSDTSVLFPMRGQRCYIPVRFYSIQVLLISLDSQKSPTNQSISDHRLDCRKPKPQCAKVVCKHSDKQSHVSLASESLQVSCHDMSGEEDSY